MQQPESATADTRTVGLHDRQRRCYSNRRIEGIPPFLQNIQTGICRQRVCAGNGLGAGARLE